jgi:hypothetical protein
LKSYEEIDFPSGTIRWIREGDEYVCRMTEDVMKEIKRTHGQPTKLMGPNLEEVLNAAGFFKNKEWVGLTDEEARELCVANVPYVIDMVRALEAKLKEKNT